MRFDRRPLAVAIPDGALVRAELDSRAFEGVGTLGILRVEGVYAPAGNAPVSGGYYRVVDTGVRCIRAPCFSYRATQVNGSTRTVMSDVDLRASGATSSEIARAAAALHTSNGLFARGRFATTLDGGRALPRDAALSQSAAASRLSTSQARRTSSSVVRKFPIASRSA